MKTVRQILSAYRSNDNNYTIEEAEKDLLDLFSVKVSLLQKNRLDLLNWAKSELKQEEHPKLGKRMTAYRSDRIMFLRKAVDLLSDEY